MILGRSVANHADHVGQRHGVSWEFSVMFRSSLSFSRPNSIPKSAPFFNTMSQTIKYASTRVVVLLRCYLVTVTCMVSLSRAMCRSLGRCSLKYQPKAFFYPHTWFIENTYVREAKHTAPSTVLMLRRARDVIIASHTHISGSSGKQSFKVILVSSSATVLIIVCAYALFTLVCEWWLSERNANL